MRRQYHVRKGLARSWAGTVTRKSVPLVARGSKKWAIEGARLRHARLLGTGRMFRIATLAGVVLVNTAVACHASTTECAQATELAVARVRWGIRSVNSPDAARKQEACRAYSK